MTVHDRLAALMRREEERFAREHPRSRELPSARSGTCSRAFPMHWMAKWPGGFPLFVAEARGSRFTDVDGHEYVDFCLGDTGAMSGHAPEATVRAVAEQAARGITTMLPTEDALWVADELTRRFGVHALAVRAHGDGREPLRDPARAARHRAAQGARPQLVLPRHGRRDVRLARSRAGRRAARATSGRRSPARDDAGRRVQRPRGARGGARAAATSRCVLTEPALTNVGIVHPEPGFHDALRALTRDTGTLLAIDETHTICCGPGRLHRRARPRARHRHDRQADRRRHPGVGVRVHRRAGRPDRRRRSSSRTSTSAASAARSPANALSLAAMRATLGEVLTEEAFARMIPLAERWTGGVDDAIAESGLAVARDAARLPRGVPLRARAAAQRHARRTRPGDFALERFMHLHALNRGILLTPFHNMALMSPGDDRGRRRPPHRGLPRRRSRDAPGLTRSAEKDANCGNRP